MGQGTLKNKTWNDYADDPNLTGRPRPVSYVVEWSSPPPPTVGTRVSEVGICRTSFTNATYRVDYRSVLTTSAWAVLRECVLGSGTETCVYDMVLPGQPSKFYRVVVTNCVPMP
jgi:hypothetical protein